jgi:hypothetical protein
MIVMMAMAFEFFAYFAFGTCLISTTYVSLEARKGDAIWKHIDLPEFLIDIKVRLIVGTLLHLACGFLVT